MANTRTEFASPSPQRGRAHQSPSRRRWLVAAAATLLGAGAVHAAPPGEKPTVEVWKSPTCGCCNDWIKHLRANGFDVKTYDDGNTDARARLGMPLQFGSCHTARVAGYTIEGHVPARDIRRLLDERPAAVVGLAVPAMPVGSPGMDGPEYGGRRDSYDVLMVRRNGTAAVYQSYR